MLQLYERVRRFERKLLRGWFERGLPVDTARPKSVEELGFEHPEWNEYAASSWLYLGWGLRGRTIDRDDVFVDFGSGLGRVALQAARRPFGRVIGVDSSPELTQEANRNLDAARRRLRCRDVAFITADAGEFSIPDDMTVAYFFNPFRGQTFQRVMTNIVASLDRQPREVTIIYVHPVEEKVLEATGRFQEIRRARGRRRLPGRPRRYELLVSRSAPRAPRARVGN